MVKKVFTVLLASTLALAMIGCGGGKSKTEQAAPAENTEQEVVTEETEKQPGAEEEPAEKPAEDDSTGAVSTDGESTPDVTDGEEAADVTDLLGTEELEKYAGQKIAFRNVTSVDTEDPGGDLLRFLYDTDGNGDPGDDLYFSIEKDGQTFLMVVTADEYGVEDGAYQAVETLEEDAVIDIEGYLYPDGAPVARITGVTVH